MLAKSKHNRPLNEAKCFQAPVESWHTPRNGLQTTNKHARHFNKAQIKAGSRYSHADSLMHSCLFWHAVIYMPRKLCIPSHAVLPLNMSPASLCLWAALLEEWWLSADKKKIHQSFFRAARAEDLCNHQRVHVERGYSPLKSIVRRQHWCYKRWHHMQSG